MKDYAYDLCWGACVLFFERYFVHNDELALIIAVGFWFLAAGIETMRKIESLKGG